MQLNEEQLKKRRRKNLALALVLAFLAALFFALTLFKLGGDVFNRPL